MKMHAMLMKNSRQKLIYTEIEKPCPGSHQILVKVVLDLRPIYLHKLHAKKDVNCMHSPHLVISIRKNLHVN